MKKVEKESNKLVAIKVTPDTMFKFNNLINRVMNATKHKPTHDELVNELMEFFDRHPAPPPATSEEEELAREFIRWVNGPHDESGKHILDLAVIQMKRP